MKEAEPYQGRIEAIVHPIMAENARKNAMRRELWAHFLALHEEEGGNTAAYALAWSRMGDPLELQRELEASVPEAERTGSRLEHLVMRSTHEDFSVFAKRLAWVCLVFGGCLLTLVSGLIALDGLWNHETDWQLKVVNAIAVIGPLFCWCYCLLLCLQSSMRYTEDMYTLSRTRHPILKGVLLLSVNLAAGLCIAPVFYFLGYTIAGFAHDFSHTEVRVYSYMAVLMYIFVWSQITLATLLGGAVSIYRSRAIEDWPYLSQ